MMMLLNVQVVPYFRSSVDPQKWLETPQTDSVEQFDDDSLSTSGWLPLENFAGIACECGCLFVLT